MVSKDRAGKYIVDHDDQWCEPEDIEEAAYDFVLNAANGPVSGEDHDLSVEPDAFLIESVAFTPEKLEAMGMDDDGVDLGHWLGLYVPDRAAYERIKSGEKAMLSVDGWAQESVGDVLPPGEYVLAGA